MLSCLYFFARSLEYASGIHSTNSGKDVDVAATTNAATGCRRRLCDYISFLHCGVFSSTSISSIFDDFQSRKCDSILDCVLPMVSRQVGWFIFYRLSGDKIYRLSGVVQFSCTLVSNTLPLHFPSSIKLFTVHYNDFPANPYHNFLASPPLALISFLHFPPPLFHLHSSLYFVVVVVSCGGIAANAANAANASALFQNLLLARKNNFGVS